MRISPSLVLASLFITAVAGSTFLAASAAQTQPASGRLPLGTPISYLPFTIDACGHYYVTRCLTGVSGQDGITISASHVSIDINGFTINAEGIPGSLDAIHVSGPYEDITISDGFVVGWGQDGVDALSATGVHLERIHASKNGGSGVKAGPASTVLACQARENGGDGMEIGGWSTVQNCVSVQNLGAGFKNWGVTITGCAASANGGRGIWMVSLGDVVTACSALDNGEAGIDGTYCVVANCNAARNAWQGINASDSTVSTCLAVENGNTGITAGVGTVVRGCMLYNNDVAGIKATEGLVSQNVCRGGVTYPSAAGIEATHDVQVIGNHVVGTLAAGIRMSQDRNFLVRNTANTSGTDYEDLGTNVFGPIVTVSGEIDEPDSEKHTANFRY